MKTAGNSSDTFHVIECQNNLIYFDQTLSDGSIGNMYSLSNSQSFNTFSIFYAELYLHILIQNDASYSIVVLNTVSETVANVYQKEINTLNFEIRLFKSAGAQNFKFVGSEYISSLYHILPSQLNPNSFEDVYQSSGMNKT